MEYSDQVVKTLFHFRPAAAAVMKKLMKNGSNLTIRVVSRPEGIRYIIVRVPRTEGGSDANLLW